MIYPEGLHGIFATPDFQEELAGAFDNQALYLQRNQHDSETQAPLTPTLGKELRQETLYRQGRAIEEYLYLGGVALHVHEIPENYVAPGSIRIWPSDVQHLIEGLHRQSASLWAVSVNEKGTVGGLIAESWVVRKAALAYALHKACLASTMHPQGLSAYYATSFRPAR